jgi:cell division protein FtsI/penicillin-binding protein 2
LLVVAVALGAAAVGVLVTRGSESGTQRIASDFVAAWTHHDYPRMYADLDPATQRRLPITQFAAQLRGAQVTATATTSRAGRPSAPRAGVVTVPVVVHTRIFGALSLRYAVPVTGTGNGAHVAWTRSLVFPGLNPGEVLTRQTTMPRRATLLTRDGRPLAAIGPAAADVLGSLGSIPPARADELRAAGYPPTAQVGISGLQRIFQNRLAGQPGGELLAGSRVLASSPPQAAPAVHTTIATKLQNAAVAALGGVLGGVVVLRPATGDVVAVAGVPFSALQPPGSTFKIVTVTGVLEAGLARPATQFPVGSFATLSGVKLQNANGESCGGTLANSFAVSCNSVFAPLGAKLGARRLVQTAESFGFNQPPTIAGVAESTIPPADKIRDDLAVGSSAIGQGQVQATTLQMALVAATIGLGGRRPTPTLALGEHQPPVRVIPAPVARTIRKLMLGVVDHGTGTAAAIPGVRVAGKTGTAELKTTVCSPSQSGQQQSQTQPQSQSQKCDPNNPKNTDAWFVAFAPATAPRVVVGVLLVGDGAGGATAAPVARQVLAAALGR